MIIAENFNAYLDPKNKWTIIFEDKKGRIISYCAIPPTKGNRTDIITHDKILNGYTFGIDAIIILIINGEPSIIYSNQI